MSFTTSAVVAIMAAAASACRPAVVQAPSQAIPADSGAFVVTLGNDTLSAETYRRAGALIEGAIVRRIPRVTVLSYTLTLAPSGLARNLEYYVHTADGEMLAGGTRAVSVVFTFDSVFTEIRRDSIVAHRVGAPSAFPELDGAVSLYALPIAALEALNQDSARFSAYVPGAPRAEPAPVARRIPGNYWVYS